jgi:hypothetical protein
MMMGSSKPCAGERLYSNLARLINLGSDIGDALSGATAIGKPNNIEKYSLRAHFDDIVGSKHQKVIPNESDL